MKKLVIFLFLFLASVQSAKADSQKWFYPMTSIEQRATVKDFGQYIDNNFYSTHPASEFPNHFYGYHAAADLETFASEKNDDVNVPVYFVTSGTISYIGSLSGYGGVVLVRLDGTNNTALYGHVRISGMEYFVGQHIDITKPTILTYLGNGFSTETSGERKHLHFAIHKGQDLYFHGHEPSLSVLNSQWDNPLDYLKSKSARTIENVNSSAQPTTTNIHKPSILERLLDFLRKISH